MDHIQEKRASACDWTLRLAEDGVTFKNIGTVYTHAVSNRHGFMTSEPHRKRHGFEVFTRN